MGVTDRYCLDALFLLEWGYTMADVILIDGSEGEGGGQIIRTSLSLSLITGKAFRIENIRAGRREPGLREQHLTCVRACRAISGAAVEGDEGGSQSLSFRPGAITPGLYDFPISTAGSTSLVFQTVFFPLALAGGRSRVRITGGTHVRWSPTFDYLSLQWLPVMKSLGFSGEISLEKAGYFPKGGGVIEGAVTGFKKPGEYRKLFRGALKKLSAHTGSSNLPSHVSRRMVSRIRSRLKEFASLLRVEERQLPSHGTNAVVALTALYEHCQASFTDLGERGKPAEKLADAVADDFFRYHGKKGALDPHMADQGLLPLCLAGAGEAVYTTTEVTGHLLTNAAVIRSFFPVEIEVRGRPGEEGRVTVAGKKGPGEGRGE